MIVNVLDFVIQSKIQCHHSSQCTFTQYICTVFPQHRHQLTELSLFACIHRGIIDRVADVMIIYSFFHLIDCMAVRNGLAQHRSHKAQPIGGSLCPFLPSCVLTFTFRALSRRFLSKATYNKYICQKKEKTTIQCCRYSTYVHRNKCQALTMVRLTYSLYTTKKASIRC